MGNLLTKKYFFGWGNIKWIIKEIGKMYSGEPSYFSKKRIESGLAFMILQCGMIHWLHKNIASDSVIVTAQDLLIWAAIECAICGYTLSHIQDEKKLNKETTKLQEEIG